MFADPNKGDRLIVEVGDWLTRLQIDQAVVDIVLTQGTEFIFEVVGHKWVSLTALRAILLTEHD